MTTGKNFTGTNSGFFYKNIIESLEDYCIFTTDLYGHLTSWNSGAQNITGYTEEEVVGQPASIFFIEADIETNKPEMELQVAREQGRAINERWHVKKDKSTFWGSGVVFPLRNEENEVLGFIKIMRDQTLELRMSRSLENERNKLEKIFEKAPAFLIVLRGADLVFERVNEAYTQFAGNRDLAGKPFLEAMPEMKGQESHIQLQQVFATGIPYYGKEVKVAFHSSSVLPVTEVYLNLAYLPDLDSDGNITGVIAHGYEVTEQIVARQVIEEAAEIQTVIQQQKEEFLGIASHELKTPVTSLKAYSQFVEFSLRKDGFDKQAELVSKMSNQIDKLQNLISDLLDVTKMNGGKLEFNDEMFDFNTMLAEVVEDLQRTSYSHQIITRLGNAGMVWADQFRISQVVTNLITNAIKYSPGSKDIVVSSSLQNGEVRVCIEDSGIGISFKNQQQLFNRFYRVSGSKENIFTGLGLGLYISSEIIKQEGGRIWVESEEGKGSVFCFALPADRRLPQR